MSEETNIPSILPDDLRQAVADIKHAIVVSQSRALRMISGQQLSLYFGIGCYVSEHSRGASWGSSAIDTISQQLQREMPGLRGFSPQSIRNMRTFAEYWSQCINRSSVASKMDSEKCSSPTSELQVPQIQDFIPVDTNPCDSTSHVEYPSAS